MHPKASLDTKTTVQVRPLDWESELADYEAFLQSLPGGLLYYSPRYLLALSHILDAEPHVLVAWSGPEIVGCLPWMVKAGPYGKILNSLPFFGSHGGILTEHPQAVIALLAAYEQLLVELKPAAATLITNPFNGVTPETWSSAIPIDAQDERIAQYIELSDWSDWSPDGFTALLEDTARRNVKKALKSGVEVTIDNSPGAVQFLEAVHTTTMAEQGGTVKPKAFFQSLYDVFIPGHDWQLYVASLDGQPIAALLMMYYHETMEYFVPVTIPDYRNVQPTALLLYHVLKDGAEQGFKRFNWGGTWLSQTGVYQFKKKWHTHESRYQYWTTLGDTRLLQQTPQALAGAYPYWYVAPYAVLASTQTDE